MLSKMDTLLKIGYDNEQAANNMTDRHKNAFSEKSTMVFSKRVFLVTNDKPVNIQIPNCFYHNHRTQIILFTYIIILV